MFTAHGDLYRFYHTYIFVYVYVCLYITRLFIYLYIYIYMYLIYLPGPSNVALFVAPMVIRYRNRQLDTLSRISDPNNFPEFDLFSLGYPSSTENRNCLLWCDTSSNENLRKKNANIQKKVQKAANSKAVTNPTDNGEGMNPLEHFFCKRAVFCKRAKIHSTSKIKSIHK